MTVTSVFASANCRAYSSNFQASMLTKNDRYSSVVIDKTLRILWFHVKKVTKSYPVVRTTKLLYPILPMTFLTKKFVDFIVQITNLEFSKTSCKLNKMYVAFSSSSFTTPPPTARGSYWGMGQSSSCQWLSCILCRNTNDDVTKPECLQHGL